MSPIDPDLWARLGPLLDQALEIPPAQLPGWLAARREEDPAMADRLELLLAREARLREELPGAARIEEFLGRGGSGLAGQSIGNYTLESPLGQGGMGSVWLARRNDGRYQGKVAVKLLSLALVGRAAEQRFVLEGTVLARLNHPNIGRLLDAGVSDIGQPYLVLEYVQGERIDEHADVRRLGPRQRIELFLAVLDAVAAAHASLIVHRDLKPSNVMVTPEGVVKLLDFGIAKLLDQGRPTGGPGTLTEEGGRAFTPEYAAPELFLGEPVSTATDIYSLGVMLYVLLSGRHPTGTQFETAAAYLFAAVNTDPVRLSDAVTPGRQPLDDSTEQQAAIRSATPSRLRRLYHGDLDTILAKTLKKRPEERYQTVAALADDLRRFLADQPVVARPDSWGYRTRKFLRRHRVAALATAAAVTALIAGTGVAIDQMLEARRQLERAQEARRRSATTVNFEALLFRLIGPGSPPMTYEQLLEKGRLALERQYRRDPRGAIQLAAQYARNYERDGQVPTAHALLDRAVRTADSLGDAGWGGTLRCRVGYYLTLEDKNDSAAVFIAAGRRAMRDVSPTVFDGTACDEAEAAVLVNRRGRFRVDSAIVLRQRIVDRLRADGDTTGQAYELALNSLALTLQYRNRNREALPLRRRLLASSRELADPEVYPVMAYNVGFLHQMLGEFQAASEVYRTVLADLADEPVPPGLISLLSVGYGWTLLELEQFDSAAVWLDRALTRTDDVGRSREYLIHGLQRRIAIRRARAEEARHHDEAARRLATDPLVAESGDRLLIDHADQIARIRGSGAEAAARVTAALATWKYGPNMGGPVTVAAVREAASVLIEEGDYAAAIPYADHLIRTAGPDSVALERSGLIGHGLLLQGRALLGTGDTTAARSYVRRSLAPLESGFGGHHSLPRWARALADSIGDRR
ncbi:MAG: serine/threonine protein kinase [Gemmatimonadetes bacterium]|nr:serine/threonine protein kinase [Gemmatimonadota bacterium]